MSENPDSSGSDVRSATYVFLRELKERGVDKLFMVSGTDYAAFIEEKSKDVRNELPDFFLVPHEITAAAAAMGYSIGGKIGAVAVHTTPGTANALGMIMNAHGSKIPLLIIAGRSPYTERGSPASRNLRIHWLQECRDQGEMVRQWVKWDFEIRTADQIPETVSRAIQLALSEPQGPVYVTLPREVSIEKIRPRRTRASVYEPGPSRKALDLSVNLINRAENPVIITWRAGKKKEWFESLKAFADRVGIPVLNYVGEYVNYPSSGISALDNYDLSKVDLVITVEVDVPWIPKYIDVNAKVIRVDTDPGFASIPFYGFPCDVCIQSTPSEFFDQILYRVKPKEWNKEQLKELKEKQEDSKRKEIERLSDKSPIHPRYLSYKIGELGLAIMNEYTFNPRYAKLDRSNSYFGPPAVGTLGWAIGAAIGYKLATGNDVIATVGDGSFIFGVPDAFYYASLKVPVMVVIYDNGGWYASALAVKEVFPEGNAVKNNRYPGADFEYRMRLGESITSYGGFYKLVEDPQELDEALKMGADYVTSKNKPAIIQVITERDR